jgi:hypothetical protein
MRDPGKIIGIVLIAIAVGSLFVPGNQPFGSLIIGAFGIGLFFFGDKK